MTRKLLVPSWISAESPPNACRLAAFFLFTQAPVARVSKIAPAAGASAASPSRVLSPTRKRAAPVMKNVFPVTCTSACEKNWFTLSVVVDARNQITGLVLIEEVYRQFLEFREQALA